MRRTLLISALTILLTVSTHAEGEMQCPPPAPPPPGTANVLLVPAGEDAALDSFTQTVINVLRGVLALV
jgi:hypothetical protein